MRGQLSAVAEADDMRPAVRRQSHHISSGQHLRLELHRLATGAVGELRPGPAAGKAEVIFDPGALTSLSAGRPPLDQNGVQALRCTVDGGTQTGRTSADDDQVIEVAYRSGRQADGRGDLGRCGR